MIRVEVDTFGANTPMDEKFFRVRLFQVRDGKEVCWEGSKVPWMNNMEVGVLIGEAIRTAVEKMLAA